MSLPVFLAFAVSSHTFPDSFDKKSVGIYYNIKLDQLICDLLEAELDGTISQELLDRFDFYIGVFLVNKIGYTGSLVRQLHNLIDRYYRPDRQ